VIRNALLNIRKMNFQAGIWKKVENPAIEIKLSYKTKEG
jgi:hypothetical protein